MGAGLACAALARRTGACARGTTGAPTTTLMMPILTTIRTSAVTKPARTLGRHEVIVRVSKAELLK